LTVFYIKLIVFVSKGFNPRFDFSLKSDANGWAAWCIAWRTEKASGVEARRDQGQGRAAWGDAAGSIEEEEEQGRGMGPWWVSAQGQRN
jgi:hypothetical protein